MGFSADMLRKYESSWKKMLDHPFLREVADGSIPDDRFANWLRQDYVFVREAIPFVALMIPKAPLPHRKALAETIVGFHQELELFEKMAKEHGVDLVDVVPAPTNRGYIDFLLRTAALEPYELAFTALYAGEKAYLDSWQWVKDHQQERSRWQAFIDHWSSEAFRGWVEWIAAELDQLADKASPELRARMEERFVDGLRYEYRFWELAYRGESWGVAE